MGGEGGGQGGGGGGRGLLKEPLCPVRNRLWSMSLRGVGGLFLHGKAAGAPACVGGKAGKREVFI